jgi:DNA-binding transcriptional MerR regulator
VASENKRTLRSGELAKLAGVSSDTLRLYERKGLLSKAPRSPNGYRAYPPDALERIHLVRAALAIGFTLDELAEILARRDRGRSPCVLVRDLASEKLRNLEEHVRQLTDLRDRLRNVPSNGIRLFRSLRLPSARDCWKRSRPPRPRVTGVSFPGCYRL